MFCTRRVHLLYVEDPYRCTRKVLRLCWFSPVFVEMSKRIMACPRAPPVSRIRTPVSSLKIWPFARTRKVQFRDMDVRGRSGNILYEVCGKSNPLKVFTHLRERSDPGRLFSFVRGRSEEKYVRRAVVRKQRAISTLDE